MNVFPQAPSKVQVVPKSKKEEFEKMQAQAIADLKAYKDGEQFEIPT